MRGKESLRALCASIAIATSVVPAFAEQQHAPLCDNKYKKEEDREKVVVDPVDVILAQEWFAGKRLAAHAYVMAEATTECKISIGLFLVIGSFETGGGSNVGENDGWLLRWPTSNHEKEIRDVAELLAGKGNFPSYAGKTNIQKLHIFNSGSVDGWNSITYRDNAKKELDRAQEERKKIISRLQTQTILDETVGTDE